MFQESSQEQRTINMIGLGPDSESIEALSDSQIRIIKDLMTDPDCYLELRDLPQDQSKLLVDCLQVGQSIKIGGVKYSQLFEKALLTDLFGGNGPKHSWYRGH